MNSRIHPKALKLIVGSREQANLDVPGNGHRLACLLTPVTRKSRALAPTHKRHPRSWTPEEAMATRKYPFHMEMLLATQHSYMPEFLYRC